MIVVKIDEKTHSNLKKMKASKTFPGVYSLGGIVDVIVKEAYEKAFCNK